MRPTHTAPRVDMVPTPANCRPLSPERLTAHRRKRTRPVISDGLCVLVRKNPSIPDRDRDDLFVGVQVEEPSASVSVPLVGWLPTTPCYEADAGSGPLV